MQIPADHPAPSVPARRRFVLGSTLALAGLAIGCTRRSEAAGSASPATAPGPGGRVRIAGFTDDGTPTGVSEVAMVVKPDAAWRKQLSPLAYQVTRHAATERPFTGALLDTTARGVYRCICCDTALFDSRTKFHSGTGWPSFWQPIARENVLEATDRGFGMVRTEVRCRRCDAHLGHVFDDGPRPTGLRYCMNSVALRFAAAA